MLGRGYDKDEKGYVGACMFMVNVVEYVIGKVNVMVEYMLGGMHDIVVSVLINVCGGAVYSTFINRWVCIL